MVEINCNTGIRNGVKSNFVNVNNEQAKWNQHRITKSTTTKDSESVMFKRVKILC